MPKRPMLIGNIPKLPASFAAYILPLILSGIMSGIISMVNIIRHSGLIDGLFWLWLPTWLGAWLIAYPLVLLLLPMVRRITAWLVDMPPPPPK